MNKGINRNISSILRFKEIGAVSGLLTMLIFFSFLSEMFLTVENFVGIFTITSELGIIAIGICFLMIAGEFDLSVGSVFALAPAIGTILMNSGVPAIVAFIAGLVCVAFIGFINGYIVTQAKIPSFIVTLGSMMFFRGFMLALSGGFPIIFKGQESWLLGALAGETVLGMKASGIWLIILTICFSLILNRTKYGNHVSATGGNADVAKAVGINTTKIKIINFVICSLLAGLAGFMMFARFRSIDPVAGNLMELEAIASAVIGGALLTGGYGSVFGAFLGAFLIGLVRSGLILGGAPAYWYKGFIGVVLVIAVIINTKVKKKIVG